MRNSRERSRESLFCVEFLYQLTHFGDVEEVVDIQLVVGLDTSVDILAFQVVQTRMVGGVAIAEAIGRGVVEHAA